ncbi:MAG: arsenate reductase (glutaredoxin), partial [Gallionella sp.]
MNTLRIYHNPHCSKCRATCALIAGRGYSAEVVNYLETPPGKEELRALLEKLGMQPAEIVRRGEDIFREQYAHRTLGAEEWLDALV